MDLVIGLLWCVAFFVIVLFLGALNYFLGRPSSYASNCDTKPSTDTTINQPQSNKNSTSSSRRRSARNANKKQRLSATVIKNENLNSNNDSNQDKQEIKSIEPEINREQEEEELLEQASDESQDQKDEEEEEEFHDPTDNIEDKIIPSPPPHIEEEQEPILPVKHRHKNKNNLTNGKPLNSPSSNSSSTPIIPSKQEPVLPPKPQASVIPVKQALPSLTNTYRASNLHSQDNNYKLNGNVSSSSANLCTYSGNNSLPPRFQRQQNEMNNTQRVRKRKVPVQPKNSTIPPGSAARQNDFVPGMLPQHTNNGNHVSASSQQQQHMTPNQNGYSSESDVLSESPSTTNTNNNDSPVLSTSTESSRISLKSLDLMRSISSSKAVFNELVSIFDTVSFSSDELDLILSKISTKQLFSKHNWQRLLSATTKNDQTIERILDETYRSQAKILAIELQTEQNRVLELTKTNAEMDNTIRQLQQQQQQQPNNNIISYQQTIVSYQMQFRKLNEENVRLAHQLHAYSMMPVSINELKQQLNLLNEQLRQSNIKNSALEKEVSDGERASKQATEIYKKSDGQKQERMDQMIADINRYKKMDKELTSLRQQAKESEKDFHTKLADITRQRDDLQARMQDYEQLKVQYDELRSNSTQTRTIEDMQQELDELKGKNDLLRQRNWKIMEQLNKLSHERDDNEKDQSSQSHRKEEQEEDH